MKGTVRAIVGADTIETIDEVPDAGRAFNGRVDQQAEVVGTLERQVEMHSS